MKPIAALRAFKDMKPIPHLRATRSLKPICNLRATCQVKPTKGVRKPKQKEQKNVKRWNCLQGSTNSRC